ncbi:hypothetical protein K440DRAFT_204780 [Wilcoxina mikolae CBS 423.85]|nr:hypothetical protein K440DRAFT_204780 [Wilcoxina mikolae CBS 423.85]
MRMIYYDHTILVLPNSNTKSATILSSAPVISRHDKYHPPPPKTQEDLVRVLVNANIAPSFRYRANSYIIIRLHCTPISRKRTHRYGNKYTCTVSFLCMLAPVVGKKSALKRLKPRVPAVVQNETKYATSSANGREREKRVLRGGARPGVSSWAMKTEKESESIISKFQDNPHDGIMMCWYRGGVSGI